MKTHRGVCGFCLTGQCCKGLRTFDSFTCSHAKRCGLPTEEEDPMKGLEEAWHQLDEEVDAIVALAEQIKSGEGLDDERALDAENLGRLQARARGKAEILAVFMTLYGAWGYNEKARKWTADEVSTEAGKRRALRTRGQEYFTILTLGQLLQYEADGAWKRDGHGFLRVAS